MYTTEQLKEAGLDDFKNFLAELWIHLDLRDTKDEPSPPTVVQNDIADFLQHGPRRRIIEAFRGVGKSYITCAFVLWCWLHDPQLKILIVSANQDLADEKSTFIKALIDSVEWLSFLRPSAAQRASALKFDVGPATPDQSPSLKSAGMMGQITGSRADIIIADDIEIPKNSMTHLMRERLADLVKEFDAVLKPQGRIIYLGTPQVEESLYNRLPARGYTIRVWPAQIPPKADRYFGRLAPYVTSLMDSGLPEGTPVDPARFDDEDLAERRASFGFSGYQLQFMLDTNPSDVDRHPLRLKDFVVDTLDSDHTFTKTIWTNTPDKVIQDLGAVGFDGDFWHWGFHPDQDTVAPFTKTIMAIDPSGDGPDETAYAIVRVMFSTLYLVASGGYREGFSEETLNGLASKAAQYGVNEVLIEPNFGGGMFNSLFLPVLHKVCQAKIDPDLNLWSVGQKEKRIIEVLEPLLNSHRLVVDRAVIERDLEQAAEDRDYSLFYQLTRLTKDRDSLPHDDRLEALQLACSYFTKQMKASTDKAVSRHKGKLMDQELKRFAQHVTHYKPTGSGQRKPHIRRSGR